MSALKESASKEDLVISIGGSILLPDSDETGKLEMLVEKIKELSEDYDLYLVVGGGWIARRYIDWGRKMGGNEATLDELGIETSRLNARLMILGLGKEVYPVPAEKFDEAITAGNHYDIVAMGGTHPGHTTDAVAAMLAERLNVDRMINATSVDGVYTSDPMKNEDAEKIEELGYDRLLDIVSKGPEGAGSNVVFDPLAAKIIKRAEIKTYIVDGNDVEALERAVRGKDFHGSIIG